MGFSIMRRFEEVNRELWLLLSMFIIAAVFNYVLSQHRVMLGFYALPTIYSAYFYGRRHATLTALASVLVVILVVYFNPSLMNDQQTDVMRLSGDKWFDLTVWGGLLLVTAYSMGTLYERNAARLRELRQTYHGILMILRQFISKDKYTQNHSYRVSIYAAKIAAEVGLDTERIEDVRAAAMLHDIGKLDISRELLYKAARLSEDDFKEMKSHVEKGAEMLEAVGGSLRRVIPIVLAHHDKFDGSGYHPTRGNEIPMEARIISVADVYDSLTSDRPYRKAMSPFDAKEIITRGAGTDFDPHVVDAFLAAFQKREMEVPELVI